MTGQTRLVLTAGAVWTVTVAAGGGVGVAAGLSVAAALLAAAGALSGHWGVAALALALVGTAAAMLVRVGDTAADRDALDQWRSGTGDSIEVTLSDHPRLGRVAGTVTVRATAWVGAPDKPADSRSVAIIIVGDAESWAGLISSQRVVVTGRWMSSSGPFRAGILLSTAAPVPRGGPSWWMLPAAHIRARFAGLARAAFGTSPTAGLAPAMVLGDETGTQPQTLASMRAAGLAHMTAVSGANFAVLAALLTGLGRLAGIGPRARLVLVIAATAGFALVVGPAPSVLRAAVVGGLAGVILLGGREARPVHTLAVGVLLLLWSMPELAFAPGFALSVAATSALLAARPLTRAAVARCDYLPAPLIRVALAALAAGLGTAPLLLFFGADPALPGSLLANTAAAPAVVLITMFGTAAALIGPLSPEVSVVLLRCCGPELSWIIAVADWFG